MNPGHLPQNRILPGSAAVLLFAVLGSGCTSPDGTTGTAMGGPAAGAGGDATAGAGAGATAGTSGAGGSDTSVAAGGAAGSSAFSDCPAWPPVQLLPAVGPWFYGPHPGPCTMTIDPSTLNYLSTYRYDSNNQLVSVENEVVFTFEDGLLVQSVDAFGTTTYVYEPGRVAETRDGEPFAEYTLNEQGYVTSAPVNTAAGDQGQLDKSRRVVGHNCPTRPAHQHG